MLFRSLYVLRALSYGVDGGMDGKRERVPMGKMPVTHAGHDIERAVDSQRHNGQLQLVGQSKSTFLEQRYMAGERASSLWEHDHGAITRLQNVARLFVGAANLPHSTLVDHDLMRLAAGIAHEGNLLYLVFHHPLEVTSQVTVDEENVEGSLMVGHKDVRLVRLQMFPSLNTDGQEEGTGDDAGPPTAGIVAPIVTIAQSTADADEQCRPDGHQDCDGNGHEELIDII